MHILIDTNIFVQNHFSLGTKIFQEILDLINDGKIVLLTNNIIKMELHNKILEYNNEVTLNLKSVAKKYGAHLTKANSESFNKIIDRSIFDNEVEKITANYTKLFSSNGVINIDIQNSDTNDCFDRFFDRRPPFGGKEEKKLEFPDAFILSSTYQWAKKNKTSVTLVSKDKKWKEYIEKSVGNVDYCDCLSKILENIARRQNLVSEETIDQIFKTNLVRIKSEIEELVSDIQYSNEDICIDDEIYVDQITLEPIEDYSLISSKEDVYIYSIDVSYSIRGTSTFTDYSHAFYDKEENKYWGLESYSNSFLVNKNATIVASIEIDTTGGKIDFYDTNIEVVLDLYDDDIDFSENIL